MKMADIIFFSGIVLAVFLVACTTTAAVELRKLEEDTVARHAATQEILGVYIVTDDT